MSNGRKFLFIISFIVVDILLISGIFIIRDFTGKNIFKNEVNALSELDFTKDSYNTEIKSKGEYAVAEKAIKKYLDDYATEVQITLNVQYDEKLNNMLDISSLKEDKTGFVDSLDYLDTLRNNFNYNVDLIMNRVTKDEIKKYIYNYDVTDESVDIYNNILIESSIISKIEDNQLYLENKRLEINSYIDSVYNVLVFLKNNAVYYSFVGDEIIFSNKDIENKYFELVDNTKRIYK